MRLSVLQRLRIGGIEDKRGSLEENKLLHLRWTSNMFPPASTTVRFLEVAKGPLDGDAISSLINACSKLHYFCYGDGLQSASCYNMERRREHNIAKVWEALRRHRTSLHSLALYYTGYRYNLIESLVDFTAMERVCIDARAVSLNNSTTTQSFRSILPPHMKVLRILARRLVSHTLNRRLGLLLGKRKYLMFPLTQDSGSGNDEDSENTEHLERHWRGNLRTDYTSNCGESHIQLAVWEWKVPKILV